VFVIWPAVLLGLLSGSFKSSLDARAILNCSGARIASDAHTHARRPSSALNSVAAHNHDALPL
jgi:hypothetical protein